MKLRATTLALLIGATLAATPASAEPPFLPGAGLPKRARVVIVQDPESIIAFNSQPEKIDIMIGQGLTAMTGKGTSSAAWQSLMTTQDVVGLKVY